MKRLTTIFLAGLIFLAPAGAGAAAITFTGSNLGFGALITDLGGGSIQWDFSSFEAYDFSIAANYGAKTVYLNSADDPSLLVVGGFSNDPFSGAFSLSTSADPLALFSFFDTTFGGTIIFDPVDHTLEVSKGVGIVSDSLLTSLFFDPPPGFDGAFYVSALFDFDFTGSEFGEGTLNSFTLAATPVPEPGTMMLLGAGLVGLAGWGRKRFRG